MTEAMEFLMRTGGGAPTAKFPTVGTEHKGLILGMEKRQQTEFGTKKPLVWDNGDPRWELEITLQTDERDDSIEDDDGRRRVFAKGNMMYAIREAIVQSGWAGSSVVGGKLAVKYVGDGETSRPGMNPPKKFAARFKAPEEQPEEKPEEYDEYDGSPF